MVGIVGGGKVVALQTERDEMIAWVTETLADAAKAHADSPANGACIFLMRPDGSFLVMTAFQDRLPMIGALEFLKHDMLGRD